MSIRIARTSRFLLFIVLATTLMVTVLYVPNLKGSSVTTGNLGAAGPQGPVLTTLVSVDPIYLSFDADEQAVIQALDTFSKRDQLSDVPVRVTGQGIRASEGRLQLLDNQIDPRSGTVRMRAVLANPEGQLMPGQFARLQMGQAQMREAILVEERSIGTDQDRRYVMVVDDQNKVSYRQVSLGARVDDAQHVVTSGLAEGDRIIVEGLQCAALMAHPFTRTNQHGRGMRS